jgi:type I restriction enzyme R subunit
MHTGRFILKRGAECQMKSLIELKYDTIGDAVNLLGSTSVIRETFVGFQKYLYE